MQNEQETLSPRGGTSKRLTYIDIAKGIGIFLVVVGHCIPDATSATGIAIPAYRWLHDVIYSFHMPLFFFLAGFMVSRQKMLDRAQKPLDLVRKRVSRLLVPYVFVGLCYAPFKMLLSNFANKPYDISTIWQIVIGVNPDGELWFLYALFVITVIAALFAFRISLLGLVAAAALLIWNPWGIITNFLFFFLLGIYMRREHKDFVLHLTARYILTTVAVFLLGLYGLLGLKEHACFLLTATSGTVLVLWLSLVLSRQESAFSPLSSLLEHWGILSMDIYILSDIIKIPFRVVLWNKLHLYTLSFVLCTVLAIVLSVWLSEHLIRKNSWLRFLILGVRK